MGIRVQVIRKYVRSICVDTSVVPSGFLETMQYDPALDSHATVPIVAVGPQRVMLTEAESAVFRKRPDRVELWRPIGVFVLQKLSSVAAARGNRATITTTYGFERLLSHADNRELATAS